MQKLVPGNFCVTIETGDTIKVQFASEFSLSTMLFDFIQIKAKAPILVSIEGIHSTNHRFNGVSVSLFYFPLLLRSCFVAATTSFFSIKLLRTRLCAQLISFFIFRISDFINIVQIFVLFFKLKFCLPSGERGFTVRTTISSIAGM